MVFKFYWADHFHRIVLFWAQNRYFNSEYQIVQLLRVFLRKREKTLIMANNSNNIDNEQSEEELYRLVSQNTVDKHWKPLSTKSRQHIHDLILSSVP